MMPRNMLLQLIETRKIRKIIIGRYDTVAQYDKRFHRDDDVCMGWWPVGLTVTEGPFLLDALMHTFAPWHCCTTIMYFMLKNNAAQ